MSCNENRSWFFPLLNPIFQKLRISMRLAILHLKKLPRRGAQLGSWLSMSRPGENLSNLRERATSHISVRSSKLRPWCNLFLCVPASMDANNYTSGRRIRNSGRPLIWAPHGWTWSREKRNGAGWVQDGAFSSWEGWWLLWLTFAT